MDWMKMKPDGKEYKHLLKFFKAHPAMLVNCGIYREDNDGIYYFYTRVDRVAEHYLPYTELDGRPIKPTLTKIAKEVA